MYLKVTLDLGTSPQQAAEQTLELATRLGVNVEFDFNGVKCVAFRKRGNPEKLAEAIERVLKAPSGSASPNFACN